MSGHGAAPLRAPQHPREDCRNPFTGQPLGETVDRLVAVLREARRICLVTHLNPDGDALGSTAAMAAVLSALGKEAVPIVYEPLPARLQPCFPEGMFRVVPDEASAARLEPADLFFVLDTSEPGRLGPLAA